MGDLDKYLQQVGTFSALQCIAFTQERISSDDTKTINRIKEWAELIIRVAEKEKSAWPDDIWIKAEMARDLLSIINNREI